MQLDSVENAVLSVAINPVLKKIIRNFDVYCPKDGNLLINSLRVYLGENLSLCERCEKLTERVAKPFYEFGSRLLKVDKGFMRKQFIQDQYGEAWFRGFALMMRGIRKYGIRIPFTPAAPFLIVWNYTYKCNLRCKHCYEDAGRKSLNSQLMRQSRF